MLTPSDIRISEAFFSLQGEGPSIGQPAHFIRLQGCTVGCRWCDTRYSWDATQGSSESPDSVASRLRSLGAAELLVVTGGEPLENPRLDDVLQWASRNWRRVEVETSGAGTPPRVEANVSWNWSPKLPSVTPRWKETWRNAQALLQQPASVCKVVVDSDEDWSDFELLRAEWDVPPGRVVIIPQGNRPDAVVEKTRWLAKRCIESGFRLTTRLHVLVWGGRRGV